MEYKRNKLRFVLLVSTDVCPNITQQDLTIKVFHNEIVILSLIYEDQNLAKIRQ